MSMHEEEGYNDEKKEKKDYPGLIKARIDYGKYNIEKQINGESPLLIEEWIVKEYGGKA